MAVPARVPPRFLDLALQQTPRAMAVLAHIFAMMKLLALEVPWYAGVAEKQIPVIQDRLPRGWKSVMQWPLAVLDADINARRMLPTPPRTDEIY